MSDQQQQQQQIQINYPEHLRGGAYANSLMVAHTKEEFIMDFMIVVPPAGTITSRVITSPGNMKRIIAALQDNVQKYEKAHGSIAPAEEPKVTKGGLYL